MPVFRAAQDAPRPSSEGHSETVLLDHALTKSDACEVARIRIPAGRSFRRKTGSDEIAWFMVLEGRGRLGAQEIGASHAALALPGTDVAIEASDDLDLLWTRVPKAERFDAGLASLDPGLRVVDWGREPVLQSEHDARTRVYMATPGLVGTGAIKAEMIAYPPGTAAPEHHHEGAEHFQFVLSGHGTAVLSGSRQALGPGDVLYNFENERHYFFTDPDADADFVFVEFFIPGHCRTVWAPEAKACAWLPTGRDSAGNPPSREIGHHVHGEDAGL